MRDRTKMPIELRRELFLDVTASIGRELDAKRVTDEDIEQHFAAFRKRRRGSGGTPLQQPAGTPAVD